MPGVGSRWNGFSQLFSCKKKNQMTIQSKDVVIAEKTVHLPDDLGNHRISLSMSNYLKKMEEIHRNAT